ncbi:Ribosomal protein L5 eukaryotic/L18 archaeal [Cynara cardunculus var. scolymus]|uniref:Ribosomal protein L5 eukaryotic/L18 archaeal n=1 Tax=Cynara cardunculus var. scolymus TaxID=59895 RepID=A0A103XC12_CYNCS|nr:Ribosomal protein L5 eukaryotic/L18 archaeal [Cynara cardunculus var. scolymus]
MDEEYEGNLEATGEDYSIEPADSRRPFRALLDVGLIRTTTANCVLGALKGAFDGGLDIPHSEKFVGFSKDGKQLDANVNRKYIYGGHVASSMGTLMEDEPEKYQSHFSEYIKAGVDSKNIEELYKKVHSAIRANPTPKKLEKQPPMEHNRFNLKKLTYDERKQKLIERLNALNAVVGGVEANMFDFELFEKKVENSSVLHALICEQAIGHSQFESLLPLVLGRDVSGEVLQLEEETVLKLLSSTYIFLFLFRITDYCCSSRTIEVSSSGGYLFSFGSIYK